MLTAVAPESVRVAVAAHVSSHRETGSGEGAATDGEQESASEENEQGTQNAQGASLALGGHKIVGEKVLHPVRPSELSDSFRIAFYQVIRKLLLLQQQGKDSKSYRYLSKNNANISKGQVS